MPKSQGSAKSQGSTKSQGSAAVRRREQQKQREQENNRREPQKQRQQGSNQRTQPQARNQRRMQPKSNRRTQVLVGAVLLAIAAVVAIFIFISSQSSKGTGNGGDRSVAPASVVNEVTQVDSTLLSQIGTGGVANPFKLGSGSPLTGSGGKPEVFFYGAEWCPLCAAERWSMVAALSRFGTFHNLNATMSSSTDTYPNTPTFSFYGSSYSSSYIDFVPIENADRQQNTLQNPTSAEQQILNQYNVSGYPFMDIGNKYLIESASYDPAVLRTNPSDPSSSPLSMQEIADQLSTKNTISNNVLGVANYLTAAICTVTNNAPSSVCNDPAIQSIESSIAKTTPQANASSSSSSLLALTGEVVMDVRRW